MSSSYSLFAKSSLIYHKGSQRGESWGGEMLVGPELTKEVEGGRAGLAGKLMGMLEKEKGGVCSWKRRGHIIHQSRLCH